MDGWIALELLPAPRIAEAENAGEDHWAIFEAERVEIGVRSKPAIAFDSRYQSRPTELQIPSSSSYPDFLLPSNPEM